MSVNKRSQLFKGILEACILKVIEGTETYGYEISERLRNSGIRTVSAGTIYPLLLRLETKGLVSAIYRPSPLGPQRKYYRLTDAGKAYLNDFSVNWHELQNAVDYLFSKSGGFNHGNHRSTSRPKQ